MKVLQINAVYGFSSTGRTCKELQESLLKRGIECFTVYGERKGDFENTKYIGNFLDHKLHALFSRISGKIGYGSKISTRKLIHFIEAYKPDIVHLRNLHGNYVNIPMLLKYLGKEDIATVITLHDCFLYTGKCCYYTETRCEKWKNVCGNCPTNRQWNKSWFFDRTQKMFLDKKKLLGRIGRLAVVGVSKWISDEAKLSPLMKNAHTIDYVYNWINFKSFYYRETIELRKKLRMEGEKIILGVSALWVKDKGLNDFIELEKRLPKNYEIVLVGKLKEEMVLPKRITCVGATSSVDELAEYYSMADVFVSPSVQETFGKVVAEALSCGTPACVYETTALPELVANGCGEKVPVHNIDALAVAIKTICENGKEFYREQCINHAKKNFDLDTNVAQYLQIYESLLSAKE